MYQPSRLLERELRFTQVYRAHQQAHKAIRELCVLEQQILHYFVTPREDDLLAGRIDRPLITFSPCLEGDGIDKVGYAIDEDACRKLLAVIEQDPSYDAAYADEVRGMIDFWHTENTNAKIRRRIPGEYAAALYTDDYNGTPAAIHPIYRLAGAHLDFKTLYRCGLSGLMAILSEKAGQTDDPDKKALYTSMQGVLELLKTVLRQYAGEIQGKLDACGDDRRRKELGKMQRSLVNLLDNPPATFQEALQLQTIYMLAGRVVELGRLDDYMSGIYQQSLREGTVTREEAVRLLNNFFSIIEEERGRDTRAIIGGLGRENPEAADDFALLVLDVLELRQFNFYPQVSLRCHKGMNEALYDRSLELLGRGYPFPLLYNDDVNIPSVMRAMDVPWKIAEQYSFFGCGEFMLNGRSIGTPNAAVNISKILELTLFNGLDPRTGALLGLQTGAFTNDTSYDALMARFQQQLDHFCDAAGTFEELLYDVCNEECSFLQISILQQDCIERGKGILDGGLYHLGGTAETYGNVTAYDSMAAIRHVIYDKQLMTQEQLLEVLKADFAGYERERLLLKNAPKFGNDDPRADDIAVELHEYICSGIRRQRERTRLDSFLVVIINNSMNVTLGSHVGATPDGRKSGTYLSNGNSPVNGADKEGLPALIHSMTKLDTSIHACGSQNIKVSPAFFRDGCKGIKAVIAAFFGLGGQQLNLSIVDQADLEDAMIHPEEHENLVVRVGGWSARFVTIDPEIQRDILQRTAY